MPYVWSLRLIMVLNLTVVVKLSSVAGSSHLLACLSMEGGPSQQVLFSIYSPITFKIVSIHSLAARNTFWDAFLAVTDVPKRKPSTPSNSIPSSR